MWEDVIFIGQPTYRCCNNNGVTKCLIKARKVIYFDTEFILRYIVFLMSGQVQQHENGAAHHSKS